MRSYKPSTFSVLGVAVLCLAMTSCEVPPEGSPGFWAVVQYEIEIEPGGFASDEIQGFPRPICVTTPIEWVVNKRLDAQEVPEDIPRVGQLKMGEVHSDGNCVLASPAFNAVPPGEYRVAVTDYSWTATCDVTLIAQETSGQAHRLRFLKGQDGCTSDVIDVPAPE